MSSQIEQTLIQKVRALPIEKQQELLQIVERFEQRSAEETIWEKIEERAAQVPLEEWADAPRDGSMNVDHYLYGAPKREQAR